MKIGLMVGREYSFPPAFIERVNTLGRPHGITAEFVKLAGTKMDEPPPWRVIVDRISHEVEYYRGFLKLAALNGTYVINNPFWWTADDKFFNYAVASKLGVAIPKTVLLPQKAYPSDVDILPASLRNLDYPIDWDGLLDYVGRPAILKPYSGGGWKHVYKVNNREELIAAYDGTAPYAMTLQQFVHFKEYVRCFTFGKDDITPVAYDPHQRRYIVDHAYLSPELGARIVKDAQTINNALGYEMNTIEFAVQDGVPYAIDFLNPAPDFERDRITPHYFDLVIDKMSKLVIDRALSGATTKPWPRWEEMLGWGKASGFVGQPARVTTPHVDDDADRDWNGLLRPDVELSADYWQELSARMRERAAHVWRAVPLSVPASVLSERRRRASRASCRGSDGGDRREGRAGGAREAGAAARSQADAGGRAARAHRAGLQDRQHRVAARRVPAAGIAEIRRIQRGISGRARLFRDHGGDLRRAGDHGALPRDVECPIFQARGRDARCAAGKLPRVGRPRESAGDPDHRLARGADLD